MDRIVADVMVRDIVTIKAAGTLLEAAHLMREADVGLLPVLEDDEVVGVVTDRDLVVRGLARNANPLITPVIECASTSPVCASPAWHVDQALAIMAQEQIGRLPVIDDNGHVIGIVTLSSLALRGPDVDEALQTAQEVSRRSARG
jgi:CBS domain-containing protein